ncbi:MAG: aldo/keto reductase [Promethearchaeati archaeon SRVP18_Atabeyarchaeia-1]
MQYRKFGRLDWRVSALGFGCMRLPTTDGVGASGNVNEQEAIPMIRYAIDQGVNYIDTAYPYHGGNGEVIVGKALSDGYRDKVKLATKCPVWALRRPEDFDTYLNEQLKKLQTDHVDIYLFHGLEEQRWKTVLGLNLLQKAEAAIRDGRIRNLGFSFHDKYEVFREIIDAYSGWTLCQIQYNYMDTENQAGTKGLKYAASKGLAVVVMEPLRGGRLTNPPKPIQEVFDSFEKRRSSADWGLRWVWNQPEVSVALSGMSTMKQVYENIRSANTSSVNSFASKELQLIERVKDKYRERTAIPCTRCGYCMPCENGVNILVNFELYNDAIIYDNPNTARMRYARFMAEKERAGACLQCRKCEEKCPQKILVSEWMPKVHALMGEERSR